MKPTKKKLSNITYIVKFIQLSKFMNVDDYEEYKLKDFGYIYLRYKIQGLDYNFSHGMMKVADFKAIIGQKQYAKLCQGKREFIIQNSVDAKLYSTK